MTVFILTYIFSCSFAYLYSVEKNRHIALFLKILLFCSLFFPLALRYNIGTDYVNYYEQIAWDVNLQEKRWGGFELGWRPLLWVIKFFDIDVHFFFVVVAFVSESLVLKIVGKRNAYFAVVIYVSTLFLDSFSLIRQAFAALLATYGLHRYYQTAKKKWFLVVFLSCFFHDSMYFFLFFIPFFLKLEKIKSFSKMNVICICLLVYVFFTIINIPRIIFGVIANSFLGGMSRYFTDELYGGATKLGSGLGVLLKEMCIIPFILFCTSCNRYGKKEKLFMPSLAIYVLILISYIFSTQITILNRLPYIFTSYYLISIKILCDSRSKYRKVGLLLLVVIFTVNFFVNLLKNPSSAAGGLGITPYQSIFSR
ncbi:MAG: EpsG family protein [Spirochaetaceae bacterium]|nr:EpsG family protein [Spirochaetaceae bacterium]